jgi:hypothetical protein
MPSMFVPQLPRKTTPGPSPDVRYAMDASPLTA